MTISARATAGISEMPEPEQPLSEQFRVAAKEWVRLDGEARLLEADKSSKFSEMMRPYKDLPVTRAQMIVEGLDEWRSHVRTVVEARTEANMAKVRMQWVDKRFAEWQAKDATARAEMKMIR